MLYLCERLLAHKKPLKWPCRGLRGLEGFRLGKRQAWTPRKSHGCGLLPALEAQKKPLKWPCRGFRGLEGLEGSRPGKRQAWTPIKRHGCGRWKPIRSH